MTDTAGVIAAATPLVNNDWVPENQATALQGVAVKQAQGAQDAFAGIDFSDPTSVSNGITNLIKSNNVEKAGALAAFAFQQQARQSPMVQAMMTGADPNAAPRTAPTAPTAPPIANTNIPTPTGTPNYDEPIASAPLPDAKAIAAHSAATLNQTSDALGNIKSLPLDQRPAAIAALKEQLTQRGVPEAAVDQEANYILSAPDKATQDARIDEVSAHIGAHADLHGAVAQGQVPTEAQQAAVAASPQSPSVANGQQPWYVNRVDTPGYAAMAYASPVLKAAGLDVSPYLQTARELAQPYITKNAELANARGIASETSQGKLPADIALEQVKQHFINGYKDITLYPPGSTQSQTISRTQWEANPNVYAGWSMEPGIYNKAEATAAGTKEGSTAYETKTIQIDGKPTEVSIRKDANGNTIYVPVTKGSGGEPAVGASEADIADQKNLVDAVSKIPAQQLTLQQGSERGKRIIAQANQITTGKYTPNVSELAQVAAPLLGPKADLTKYANNAELLKQDLSASFKSQLGGLAVPRITSEANAILSSIPKNASPQDMIKIYGGMLTAGSNYAQKYNNHIVDFKSNPANEQTLTNAQNAWNNSPASKSLYADPVWNGVTVAGQPAVQHVTVGNHHALVVFKGLLGKNAIVERLD